VNNKFTIFAENFNGMKLSQDQKNMLKGGLSAWAGMVVAVVLFAVFGKRTWDDTLWLILGVTIAEIIVGAFLTLGSRVPKEKDENQ
jgi:glucose uptake protein GlcU